MQLYLAERDPQHHASFSILERIVVCATGPPGPRAPGPPAFSILERIVVCATNGIIALPVEAYTFSILERIVVCATNSTCWPKLWTSWLSVSSNGSWCVQLYRSSGIQGRRDPLSVSSNGSWCVQHKTSHHHPCLRHAFQYPRSLPDTFLETRLMV